MINQLKITPNTISTSTSDSGYRTSSTYINKIFNLDAIKAAVEIWNREAACTMRFAKVDRLYRAAVYQIERDMQMRAKDLFEGIKLFRLNVKLIGVPTDPKVCEDLGINLNALERRMYTK